MQKQASVDFNSLSSDSSSFPFDEAETELSKNVIVVIYFVSI